jgi:hypothetical protein
MGLAEEGTPKAAVMAHELYRKSQDWACRQGALSWELRCAISVAQLWQKQRRIKKARKFLSPVHERFAERFETADLKTEKALLVSLQ